MCLGDAAETFQQVTDIYFIYSDSYGRDTTGPHMQRKYILHEMAFTSCAIVEAGEEDKEDTE